MKRNILYSAQAKEDLQRIYTYIACDLLEPETAAGQAEAIMEAIRGLADMPMMYRLYEAEPWRTKGLRIFHVGSYAVLYLPETDGDTVHIVRIMYGGRDIGQHLE